MRTSNMTAGRLSGAIAWRLSDKLKFPPETRVTRVRILFRPTIDRSIVGLYNNDGNIIGRYYYYYTVNRLAARDLYEVNVAKENHLVSRNLTDFD